MPSLPLLLLLAVGALARPQDNSNCDHELFDCDTPDTPDDDLFSELTEGDDEKIDFSNTDCFDSANEIDDSRSQGDDRNVFNDCNLERKCDYYSEAGYSCVKSFVCREGTIITNGAGLINLRQSDRPSDRQCEATDGTLDRSDTKCDGLDMVCCKDPNFRARQCVLEDEDPVDVRQKFDDKLKNCGRHDGGLKFSETRADEAQPSEFPHQCIIFREVNGQRAFIGGASLIGRNKVLTVAHKFLVIQNESNPIDLTEHISEFVVRCGEYDVKSESDTQEVQDSQVAEIYLHPEYDERRVHNNLAILRTKENFIYQDHIGPVCLPRPGDEFSGEQDCWSSGWGADGFQDGAVYSDIMKKVQLGVLGRDECVNRLGATDHLKHIEVHESWLCIGGKEGKDTCKGDGGSPHVCRKEEDAPWVQVGTVAWGLECGTTVPAVYTSIPHSMCWIDWVMSCEPEAEENVGGFANEVFEDLFDVRNPGDQPDSVNQLTFDECQEWLDNSGLIRDCEVIYLEEGQADFIGNLRSDN